jgi:hypothetical protein
VDGVSKEKNCTLENSLAFPSSKSVPGSRTVYLYSTDNGTKDKRLYVRIFVRAESSLEKRTGGHQGSQVRQGDTSCRRRISPRLWPTSHDARWWESQRISLGTALQSLGERELQVGVTQRSLLLDGIVLTEFGPVESPAEERETGHMS